MTIEADIYSTLSTDGSVTALVSDKIYPVFAPAEVSPPFVVFAAIGELPLVTLNGESAMKNRRFQFDCYAKTFTEAKAIADAVIDALNGSTLTVTRQSLIHFYEAESDLYRFNFDYSIWKCEV